MTAKEFFGKDEIKEYRKIKYQIQLKTFVPNKNYHCGYIFVNKPTKKMRKEFVKINAITFETPYEIDNKAYEVWGFDTAHAYNTEETQTYEYVEQQIKKIIDKWRDNENI